MHKGRLIEADAEGLASPRVEVPNVDLDGMRVGAPTDDGAARAGKYLDHARGKLETRLAFTFQV